MEDSKKDSINLEYMKKVIESIEERMDKPASEIDLSFEFIIGSFFPYVYQNIRNEMSRQYILGYNAAQGLDIEETLTHIDKNSPTFRYIKNSLSMLLSDVRAQLPRHRGDLPASEENLLHYLDKCLTEVNNGLSN